MPAGVNIRGDSNNIQISTDVPNLVLLSKGTSVLSDAPWDPGSSVFTGSHASMSFPNDKGHPPIVAFSCDIEIAVLRVRLVSGNWVYTVATRDVGKTNTVEWWAFAEHSSSKTAGFGLRVMDSSGNVVFNSSLKPMVIRQYQSEDIGSSGSVSIASGRKLAIAILGLKIGVTAQIPSGAWVQYLSATGLKTNSNTGTIIPLQQFGELRWPVNFGFGAGTSGKWSAFALDVTNY